MHIFTFSRRQSDHYALRFGIAESGLESSEQHASLHITFLKLTGSLQIDSFDEA